MKFVSDCEERDVEWCDLPARTSGRVEAWFVAAIQKLAKETHERQQPQHMHARPHRVAAAVIQLASVGSVA